MKINVNKNELLIMLITILIVILIILFILVSLLHKKAKKGASTTESQVDYYNEYQQQRAAEGVTANNATASLVDNANKYYNVKFIIDKFSTYVSYLNSTASELGLIVSAQEESKALTEYKQDGLEYINDMLAPNYKSKYNVNNEYIYNNLKKFSGMNYEIDKMYVVEDSKYINTFFIYGKYGNTNFNFIIVLDNYNYTFEVYLNNYLKDNGYNYEDISTMKALHIEKIEKNENNTFQLKNINQQELVNNYYDDFVNKMKKDPKSAYNKLDSDYKSSRFKTFESFEKYINSYINSNRFLSEYKMTKYESYTELICYDNYGIVWIFNISGIMNYTILLDTYTIAIKSYDDEYKNALDGKKSQLCLNRFFEALNNQDYENAYKFLNSTYKEKNFENIDKFKAYVQKEWFTYNMINYSSVEIDGNQNYIITGTIRDIENEGSYNAKIIKKNFIVKLGNGISDFEMSFEK